LVYLLGKIQSTLHIQQKQTSEQASKQANKQTKINIPKLAPNNPFFLPTKKNSIHLTHATTTYKQTNIQNPKQVPTNPFFFFFFFFLPT
jgi:hypothetical protein